VGADRSRRLRCAGHRGARQSGARAGESAQRRGERDEVGGRSGVRTRKRQAHRQPPSAGTHSARSTAVERVHCCADGGAARNQAVAQVDQAKADITAMSGALKEAESNLQYTTILSPADGVVVARNITVGQSVAASLQAPNLFTIAEDLKRMQVYAKTDESDTGFIRPGAEATFQVDAFPTETFHGRVSA